MIFRNRIMAENPNILFLQETKCFSIDADKILARCWRQIDYVSTISRVHRWLGYSMESNYNYFI